MNLSPSTATLLAELETLSHHQLRNKDDLGILLELGTGQKGTETLERLGFYGKFVSNSFRIMQRIGKDGEGYEKLEREFRSTTEKGKALLGELLHFAPEEIRRRFLVSYVDMTPGSLQNLLSLFQDLSWYKNRMIDKREGRS
jgi:hypothetical protein